MTRLDDDVWLDPDELEGPTIGTATPLVEYAEPVTPPPRRQSIGFHGAAPGPSYPDPADRPRRFVDR